MRIPDPALVVLVGPSGSGKTAWATGRYRAEEIVSSDALRGVVGSGPHDLDASTDAFAILEQVVAARIGRGLPVVVDTLGTDDDRRRRWLRLAREAGLPAVAVLLDTPAAECRRRNAARDPPEPAPTLAAQR
jgi:predicted kinase